MKRMAILNFLLFCMALFGVIALSGESIFAQEELVELNIYQDDSQGIVVSWEEESTDKEVVGYKLSWREEGDQWQNIILPMQSEYHMNQFKANTIYEFIIYSRYPNETESEYSTIGDITTY